MLEAVEIGSRLSKEEYEKRKPELREDLVLLQNRFRSSGRSMLIVVGGDDRPGCDEVINLLNSWLDPRFVETNAFGEPTAEELARPRFWRYWRVLPARGRIGVFSGEWTLRAIVDRLRGKDDEDDFRPRIERIRRFEDMLADDGTIILKFWLHMPRKQLKKRLKEAEKDRAKYPRSREVDRMVYKRYDRVMEIAEEAIEKTSTGHAPWIAVESVCDRHRDVSVAEAIRDALRAHLDGEGSSGKAAKTAKAVKAVNADRPKGRRRNPHTILDEVDLSKRLSDAKYDDLLAREQARLHELALKLVRKGRSAVLVFEGWDAAGKGGAVRRLVEALYAQMYRIVPIAAPSEEERAHHYLWRFWRHLPGAGRVLIFDRSWYGRVLVERVEGFASREEWGRAYDEINDFEEQMVERGWLVSKFWVHISKDEQLRRFKERESTAFKRFKITEEDFRNRKRWNDYEVAVNEMVARTSTPSARWHIVPGNDKKYARIHVLRTVADGLKRIL
jgi:polyphosphate:AMP phosphotransferase